MIDLFGPKVVVNRLESSHDHKLIISFVTSNHNALFKVEQLHNSEICLQGFNSMTYVQMFRQQKRSEIVEPVFDAARRSGIGLDVVVVANGVNGRRSERKKMDRMYQNK